MIGRLKWLFIIRRALLSFELFLMQGLQHLITKNQKPLSKTNCNQYYRKNNCYFYNMPKGLNLIYAGFTS